MKFLVVFAVFFLVQIIASQEVSQEHKPVHNDQEQANVLDHKIQVTTQVSSQHQHVAQQKPVVNPQHVVSHNKQRMVRSLENRKIGQQPFKVQNIPGKCNFICNQENLTVCGFNGLCHREFESQCELNIYNCINTHKIFHIVDDISCIDETNVKCYRGDM